MDIIESYSSNKDLKNIPEDLQIENLAPTDRDNFIPPALASVIFSVCSSSLSPLKKFSGWNHNAIVLFLDGEIILKICPEKFKEACDQLASEKLKEIANRVFNLC